MTIPCLCGCGEYFSPSRATVFRIKRGEKVGYIAGHSSRGSNNPKWKGGKYKNAAGYILVKAPSGHPNARKDGYMLEHRLIASERKGESLSESEIVHHKNEVKDDNRPENLEITEKPLHTSFHVKGPKNHNFVVKTPKECLRCGAKFIGTYGNHTRNKYCSRKCANTFGEFALRAKLKDSEIGSIRALAGILSHRALAKKFGVGKTHIGRILRGECR